MVAAAAAAVEEAVEAVAVEWPAVVCQTAESSVTMNDSTI